MKVIIFCLHSYCINDATPLVYQLTGIDKVFCSCNIKFLKLLNTKRFITNHEKIRKNWVVKKTIFNLTRCVISITTLQQRGAFHWTYHCWLWLYYGIERAQDINTCIYCVWIFNVGCLFVDTTKLKLRFKMWVWRVMKNWRDQQKSVNT